MLQGTVSGNGLNMGLFCHRVSRDFSVHCVSGEPPDVESVLNSMLAIVPFVHNCRLGWGQDSLSLNSFRWLAFSVSLSGPKNVVSWLTEVIWIKWLRLKHEFWHKSGHLEEGNRNYFYLAELLWGLNSVTGQLPLCSVWKKWCLFWLKLFYCFSLMTLT